MKYLALGLLLCLSGSLLAQGVTLSRKKWYSIYKDPSSNFEVKVQLKLLPPGQECSGKAISYTYKYIGLPPAQSNQFVKWELPFLNCNGKPKKLIASFPLSKNILGQKEEGQSIDVEEIMGVTGETLTEVKFFFNEPSKVSNISSFENKSIVIYVPEISGDPKRITLVSQIPNKKVVPYNQPVTLKIEGGYLGQNARWVWRENTCNGKIIGYGTELQTDGLTNDITYCVLSDAPNKPPTTCKRIFIEVDKSSKSPDYIKGDEDYCLGEEIKLVQMNGRLGPGAQWKWYKGPSCSGNAIGEGASIITGDLIDNVGDYIFSVRAETPDGKNSSECVQKKISVKSAPTAPNSIDVEPKKSQYCKGEQVVFKIKGDLGEAASWSFTSDDGTLNKIGTREPSFSHKLSNSTIFRVKSITPGCGESKEKILPINVFKNSLSPKGIDFVARRSKKVLSVRSDANALAEGSEWKWDRKKSNSTEEKEWKSIGTGSELVVKRSKLNAYFRVRAEGKTCDDITSYAYPVNNQKVRKSNMDKKWSKYHSLSSKPASHFGFDLGLEGNAYKQNLQDINNSLTDRTGNVSGSGGYLDMSFHPLFLEGFTFGLNGIVGYGESYLNQFSNYTIDDTSYSVNYKYVKGGFGLELGTMISRNKGPMKLICFWNRDYFLNDFSASLSSSSGFYGDFTSSNNLLHEKLGFAIRFGRYSPLNKSRERGINWDFKFSLNNISEAELFDFQKGYFESIPDWQLGIGIVCWVHRAFKLHLSVATNSSLAMMISDLNSLSINNARLGLSYSFDSFH